MSTRSFEVGSFFHIIHRGVRGLPIVNTFEEKWRFIKLLRYFNNTYSDPYWEETLEKYNVNDFFLPYPDEWPERDPLVSIVCYSLMPNHFHLILGEIIEGGITTFMQRISRSMTGYYNARYDEKGGLFQGRYKAIHIETDDYLNYVSAYVMVKNPLELYPGGFMNALQNKSEALKWVEEYPFSSFGEYTGKRESLLLDKESFNQVCTASQDFYTFALDNMENFYQFKLNRDLNI